MTLTTRGRFVLTIVAGVIVGFLLPVAPFIQR